jgi:hypothetical protein
MTGEDAALVVPEAGRCDLCGVETSAVQRVALDRGYERLATRHAVQYACQSCHERKDRQRLGIERG